MIIASGTFGIEAVAAFVEWFDGLEKKQKKDVLYSLNLLAAQGPHLGFPHSSGLKGSRHRHMRELRVQSRGKPLRIFYAFDPRRMAIVLIGGDKTGQKRFYETYIPVADRLYDEHILTLRETKNGR